MVIAARETPGARLRRWSYHAVVGIAALIAIGSAIGGAARARNASSDLAALKDGLQEHRTTADVLAAQCGIPRFSDEVSLESFPVQLPAFPTKREAECARKISTARADLLQDHLRMKEVTARAEETRGATRIRLVVAVALAVFWGAGIYVGEFHPRTRWARQAPRV